MNKEEEEEGKKEEEEEELAMDSISCQWGKYMPSPHRINNYNNNSNCNNNNNNNNNINNSRKSVTWSAVPHALLLVS